MLLIILKCFNLKASAWMPEMSSVAKYTVNCTNFFTKLFRNAWFGADSEWKTSKEKYKE